MKLTADQVREAIFNGSSYASYDGAKYYADGINMQAIADELNARAEMSYEDALILLDELGLSERTCHLDECRKCSACGITVHEEASYGWIPFGDGISYVPYVGVKYCPNCGAKVVNE